MQSTNIKKIIKTSLASLLITSFTLPSISMASEEGSNVIPSETMISNPWDDSSNVQYITEEPILLDSEDVVYGEDALLIKEEIIAANEEAEKNKLKLEQEDALIENELINQTPRETTPNLSTIQALKSKSWYRTEFTALAVTMASLDCPTAGNFLKHSLQDKPTDRSYAAGSSKSNGFSKTKAYTDISVPMATAIDKANKAGEKATGAFNKSKATYIDNVGLDWYLTIGKFSYDWMAEKQSNGKWKVYIGIHDRYDYTKSKRIPGRFPSNLITLVTNHAADAQTAKAIVPYKVDLYMEQSYTAKK
ncbi:hypothetical protein [Peribacillus simplex]|uniref:hypothetical protein n=1 Tax=Peribacillus simplex TaxID=1478 RepID=UPI0021A985B2|nr:hypothetical protein [Peribacillus simplex]